MAQIAFEKMKKHNGYSVFIIAVNKDSRQMWSQVHLHCSKDEVVEDFETCSQKLQKEDKIKSAIIIASMQKKVLIACVISNHTAIYCPITSSTKMCNLGGRLTSEADQIRTEKISELYKASLIKEVEHD